MKPSEEKALKKGWMGRLPGLLLRFLFGPAPLTPIRLASLHHGLWDAALMFSSALGLVVFLAGAHQLKTMRTDMGLVWTAAILMCFGLVVISFLRAEKWSSITKGLLLSVVEEERKENRHDTLP